MHSQIAEAIRLSTEPVALLWSNDRPDEATEFKEKTWGCTMWLAAAASKGKVGCASRATFGCFGGGVGLGFGAQYKNFPGGEECFCYFLSYGNDAWEKGQQVAEQVKPHMTPEAFEHFVHGERYMKDTAQVQRFIEQLPITDIPAQYVVYKPLAKVAEGEVPVSVTFFVSADQLSALSILANYGRETNENVSFPYAAGCQNMGIYTYREAENETPRAVVGLNDLSARLYLRQHFGSNVMSFSVPWSMFNEMEGNVKGSFLEASVWRKLLENQGI